MSRVLKKCVAILIKDGSGRYLMQFRDSGGGYVNPRNALKWCFFGGAMEAGESPIQALVREFAEETTKILDEDSFTRIGQVVYNGSEISLYACAQEVEWGEIEVREGAGAGFFTREELDKIPMTDWAEGMLGQLL